MKHFQSVSSQSRNLFDQHHCCCEWAEKVVEMKLCFLLRRKKMMTFFSLLVRFLFSPIVASTTLHHSPFPVIHDLVFQLLILSCSVPAERSLLEEKMLILSPVRIYLQVNESKNQKSFEATSLFEIILFEVEIIFFEVEINLRENISSLVLTIQKL